MASDLTARLGGARSTLAFKAPCRVATTANIALTGTQTIDGIAVVAEDRVLVKDQTSGAENGIWTCKATTWERARDWDGSGDVVTGTRVYVVEGTTNGESEWLLSTSGTIVIGTTSVAFSSATTSALASADAAEASATAAAASAASASATAVSLAASVGFSWTFSTTTTMADPGSGSVRFNNVALGSVTAIAIDDLSADSGTPDVSGWIATFDDSTNTSKGTLRFRKASSPSVFVDYVVTGLTDNAGWTELAVTYATGSGSISNGDSLVASFYRAGDQGEDGSGSFAFTRWKKTMVGAETTLSGADDAGASLSYQVGSEFVFLNGVRLIRSDDYTATTGTTVTGMAAMLAGDVVEVISYVGAPNILDGSFRWTFSTTTSMADPSAGNVRLNHATVASATAIAIHYTSGDAAAPDLSTFIKSWDDSTSTNKGRLVVRKGADGSAVAVFEVTAVTDNTTWAQIAIAYASGAGAFAASDVLSIHFTRTGDAGAGSGDVVGPVSSVDNTIPRYHSTTGKIIQGSGVVVDDSNNVSGANRIDFADAKGIHDANGNEVLLFGTTASAVNELRATNAATGNKPVLAATGGDTNIIFQLQGKGTGGVEIEGTATNDSAATGYVGQIISSEVVAGSAVSLTTNTAADVTSISLTAGDWDIQGQVAFTCGASTSITSLVGAINTTTATVPAAALVASPRYRVDCAAVVPGAVELSIPTGTGRLTLAATTTVYLVARSTFTVSTLAAYGCIWARRAR